MQQHCLPLPVVGSAHNIEHRVHYMSRFLLRIHLLYLCTWLGNITAWTGVLVAHLTRKFQDRQQWRMTVNDVTHFGLSMVEVKYLCNINSETYTVSVIKFSFLIVAQNGYYLRMLHYRAYIPCCRAYFLFYHRQQLIVPSPNKCM